MSEREDEGRRSEGDPYQVIISDLRHRRDVDAAAEEEASEAAEEKQPERQPEKSEPPAAAAVTEKPAASPPEPPVAAEQDAPELFELSGDEELVSGPESELPPDDISAGEMAYLRQVFAAGLPSYLKSQLGLLLNFALLALGRAPDPATGLVAKNLPHARLAIDVLDTIITRLEPELAQAEKVQMNALLSDLKYAYMQAVGPAAPGSGAVPPGPA